MQITTTTTAAAQKTVVSYICQLILFFILSGKMISTVHTQRETSQQNILVKITAAIIIVPIVF